MNPRKILRQMPQQVTPLPDWLMPVFEDEPPVPVESKMLLLEQYEMVFPRVLEMIYAGDTLSNALRKLPIPIDPGAFMRWIKKNPTNLELYKEAKEIRTEAWAGRIIERAEGVDSEGNPLFEDVSRSKLAVDTYKWLMSADNRRTYGDTKTIDVSGGISITAALAQANQRMLDVIDAEFVEEPTQLLTEGDDDA